MTPGFYVARIPTRGNGARLTIESIRFISQEDADRWRDFIADQHPKDDVFVIQVIERPTQ